jgi:hypothetical protein
MSPHVVPDIVAQVAAAATPDARVHLIRQVPAHYGTSEHAALYSAIAKQVYVPLIGADVGYIPWRSEYELAHFQQAYDLAAVGTAGFSKVGPDDIAGVLMQHPEALQAFRLITGLTAPEFAEATQGLPVPGLSPVGKGAISALERGGTIRPAVARTLAVTIHLIMTGQLFPPRPGATIRPKLAKPDTEQGWDSVRTFAANGVPLSVLLHQRLYGGAFRQLLDATGTERGDELEDPVAALLSGAGIPFIQTGAHNQPEIERRFGLTVRPAPDFLMYDGHTDTLRAMLECKYTNDGGTARDKAARFATLRAEGQRLGGIPVFAVLGGMGWRRTRDALGPVIRDTDGRVFTLRNLPEMLDAEPLSGLRGVAS